MNFQNESVHPKSNKCNPIKSGFNYPIMYQNSQMEYKEKVLKKGWPQTQIFKISFLSFQPNVAP